MVPPMRTAHQVLADTLLGEPVEVWIQRQRPLSYRRIAAQLRVVTNNRVSVSHQTIYDWHTAGTKPNGDAAA